MRPIILLVLIALVRIDAWCQSNEPVSIGEAHTLYSKVLHEARPYFISLPESYENDAFYIKKRYPLVVLLDADTHFRSAGGIIRYMSAEGTEQIPEAIIVGIRNTDRTRDMLPRVGTSATHSDAGKETAERTDAAHFLSFLTTELLPQIDRQYRTLPYRILIGHSLAGLFSVNCFLDQALFQAYICIDPTLTWNNGYILKREKTGAEPSVKTRLFIAQANNPFEPGKNTGLRGQAFTAFAANLAKNPSHKVRHKLVFYESEDHFSVPLPAIQQGLLFVFEGYKFPVDKVLNAETATVENHYQRLFENLGVDLQPPGKVINQMGLFLLNSQKQIDKAIRVLKLNETYYPNSFVTHTSLGSAYQAKGSREQAIASYKKALLLNPNHVKAAQAIEELTR